MKLAFCLFKFFPYGGLQRDFLRIANACQSRGHSIHVFTQNWEGDVPPGFSVKIVSAPGMSNHRRSLNFARIVGESLKAGNFDAVVGFNKMPGLDVYFAADPCFQTKARSQRSWLYRLGSRYRIYLALERSVYAKESKTRILMLTEVEKQNFIDCYQTPEERFHLLPPGICREDYFFADPVEVRHQVRQDIGVGADEMLLLMVGSGFKTKGVDRSLAAIASLPDYWRARVRLVVIGQGDPSPYEKTAAELGIASGLSFIGTRNDVPRFLLAADLLLHPSYTEAAGMVLLEAMLAGLPVLCTETCGYAFHVRDAGAGLLIPAPFAQETMNQQLLQMLEADADRPVWSRNGLDYIARNDISSLPEKAADIIESVTR